jgi:hypothetical protein
MKKTIDTRQYVKNHLISKGGRLRENMFFLMQYFCGNDEIICETKVVERNGFEDTKERVTCGYFIVDENLNQIQNLGILEESIFDSENPIHEFEY